MCPVSMWDHGWKEKGVRLQSDDFGGSEGDKLLGFSQSSREQRWVHDKAAAGRENCDSVGMIKNEKRGMR